MHYFKQVLNVKLFYILLIFISPFLQVHSYKATALLFRGILISPFFWVLTKLSSWQINNESYFTFVVGAVLIDYFVGSVYHAFWVRDFTVKKNVIGLLTKLLVVVSVGFLFEGLNVLMVETSVLKDYTVMVLRLIVFLYPATSTFDNCYIMTNKKFPPMALMEKIKSFSENVK